MTNELFSLKDEGEMTGAGSCIGIASLAWPCRLTRSDSLTLDRGRS